METLDIFIPSDKQEALAFFRSNWESIPKWTHEKCMAIYREFEVQFPEDIEVLSCASLFLMTSSFIKNHYKEAVALYDQVLELFRASDNKEGEGAAHIINGACYRSLGDGDKALSDIQKGIMLIPEDSFYNRFLVIGLYQGAEILYLVNKQEDSLLYYNKALKIPGLDLYLNARILNGIGNVYIRQQKLEDAKKLLHEAHELVKDKGNLLLNARLLSDLGNCYYEHKELDLALNYENQSYELRKTLGLQDPLISNLLHFYKIYKAQNDKEKAYSSLEEAYTLANEKALKGRLGEIYAKRVDFYEQQQDYENALIELKKFVHEREHELNNSFDMKLKGIKAVHEVESAQKEATIIREKNTALSEANDKINLKNAELKRLLDELTRAKISKKSIVFTLIIGVSLCLLTEAFVDPIIDNLAYNNYISLGLKALIAISLKPIDSMYENYMIKKVMK